MSEISKAGSGNNRSKINAQKRSWQFRVKLQAFAILGNRCSRCGFEDHRALQIDHILDDGAVDRRGHNGCGSAVWKIYVRIVRGGYEDVYQLLCANCNWIKRYEDYERKFGKRVP
jgi:hypothetical protein